MAAVQKKLIFELHHRVMLGCLILLTLTGLLNLYSATVDVKTGAASHYFYAQVAWVGVSWLIFVVLLGFDYRRLLRSSAWIYFLSLILLVAVLFFGHDVSGHKSWLRLGIFSIQPVEVAKVAVVLMLARLFTSAQQTTGMRARVFFKTTMVAFVPLLLVLAGGDLGSSLFFILIWLVFWMVQGLPIKMWMVLLLICVTAAGLTYRFALKEYQRERIQVFLAPGKDPQGAGYQLVQSKIAIGAGQVSGKGYLQGKSNKLRFVPERHTDFVFVVLAEEWGFLGVMGAMAIFLLLLGLVGRELGRVAEPFGFWLLLGAMVPLFSHVVINLAGVTGLLPLTGVPLPFFSYGGTAQVAMMVLLAWAFNVMGRRRLFSS